MSLWLAATELGDFALRALERPGPNEWLALIVSAGESARAARKLGEELLALDGGLVWTESVAAASAVIEFIQEHREGWLVLSGFDAWGPEEWRILDGDRSAMQRRGTTLLVLEEPALGLMMGQAPNLASWFGGSAWRLEQGSHFLSAEERETRLSALRHQFRLSDAEVIARAEQGQLPGDPPFAEWLVLLGRGDLLGE